MITDGFTSFSADISASVPPCGSRGFALDRPAEDCASGERVHASMVVRS
jgi:hypothetical protein